jgi:outer membrane murein-binding lipoprotein Lpp
MSTTIRRAVLAAVVAGAVVAAGCTAENVDRLDDARMLADTFDSLSEAEQDAVCDQFDRLGAERFAQEFTDNLAAGTHLEVAPDVAAAVFEDRC